MNQTLTKEIVLESTSEAADTKQKRKTVFAVLSFGLVLLIAFAVLFYEGPFANRVRLFLFLLAGSFFTLLFFRSNRFSQEKHFYKILLWAIPVGTSIVLAGIFARHLSLWQCLSYLAAFLFPLIVSAVWQEFGQLAVRYWEVWYHTDELPVKPLFLYLETIPVRMKIKLSASEYITTTTISKHLKLGLGFYFALEEQRHIGAFEAEPSTKEKKTYGWIFYAVEFGFWKRFLHPEKTLAENRIKSNTKIVALQVGLTAL